MRAGAAAQRRAAPAHPAAPGADLSRPSCWPRRCRWPRAAISAWTSCATSTPTRWCPPARRRRRTCAASPTRAPAGAGRRACRPRCRRRSSTSSQLIAELRYEHYFLTVADIVRVRALAAHPVPGPRQRGQQRGLLLHRRHRGGPGAHERAVRALHQQGAQRAARHRHRLRARAPRGGDPVPVRQVRPRPRGASPAWSSATGRRARSATWARRWASRSRRSTPSPRATSGGTAGGAAQSACRSWACRVDDLQVQQLLQLTAQLLGFPRHLTQHTGGFVLTKGPLSPHGADRERRDGRPHRDRVGQGRPRCAGPAQGRRAGARHAHRDPQVARVHRRSARATASRCRTSRPRIRPPTT